MQQRRSSGRAGPVASKADKHEEAEESNNLSELIARGDSPDWATRVECFNAISEMATRPKHAHEFVAHMDTLVVLHMARLPDPHHRVACAVLGSLNSMLGSLHHSLEVYTERLLPKVFQKVLDPKEHVRELAEEVINNWLATYAPEMMMPVLLRILNTVNARVKATCLKGMTQMVPDAGAYLSNPAHTKSLVSKISNFVTDKDADLRNAAVAMHIALYRANAPSLFVHITSLSASQQLEVKRCLSNVVPSFESEIAAFMDQRVNSQQKGERRSSSGRGSTPHRGTTQQHDQYDLGHHEYEEQMPRSVESPGHTEFIPQRSNANVAQTHNVPPRQLDSATPRPESYGRHQGSHKSTERPSNKGGSVPFTNQIGEGDLRSPLRNVQQPACPDHGHEGSSNSYDPSLYSPVGSNSDRHVPPPIPPDLMPSRSAVSGMPPVPALLADVSSSSPQRRKESLQKILRLCHSSNGWLQYFGQILLVVLEALGDTEAAIRETALVVVKEMLRSQPSSFFDFIEVVMVKLLESYKDPVREVCQAAEEALEQLTSALNPHRCVETLIPLISSEEGAVLQASIRMLSKLVPQLHSDLLLELVPSICPGLFDAFKNPNADVRKAVVFCLVDIYMVLRDDFAPFLGELNTSQLKLVTIYINRTMQARGGSKVSDQIGCS